MAIQQPIEIVKGETYWTVLNSGETLNYMEDSFWPRPCAPWLGVASGPNAQGLMQIHVFASGHPERPDEDDNATATICNKTDHAQVFRTRQEAAACYAERMQAWLVDQERKIQEYRSTIAEVLREAGLPEDKT